MNVSDRCGCSPKAAQIRRMVVCESPVSAGGADRPIGGVLRGGVQRALYHLSNLHIRHYAWATCAIFVGQPFNALLHEPPPPFANRVLVDTDRHVLALQSLRAEQDHPASIRQRARRFVPPNLSFEKARSSSLNTTISACGPAIPMPPSLRIGRVCSVKPSHL